jgi:hypothetical protein
VSSQKRTCHVPYFTTRVCVAFTACADGAAVSVPSRARPTECCAQVPCHASKLSFWWLWLHAVFAAIEQRARLCDGDCHASVSSRTQYGPTVPSSAYTPPR